MGGWVTIRKIIPLRGPSCKLRLSRLSARLRFQDGPSVAITRRTDFRDTSKHIAFIYDCKKLICLYLTLFTLSYLSQSRNIPQSGLASASSSLQIHDILYTFSSIISIVCFTFNIIGIISWAYWWSNALPCSKKKIRRPKPKTPAKLITY